MVSTWYGCCYLSDSLSGSFPGRSAQCVTQHCSPLQLVVTGDTELQVTVVALFYQAVVNGTCSLFDLVTAALTFEVLSFV